MPIPIIRGIYLIDAPMCLKTIGVTFRSHHVWDNQVMRVFITFTEFDDIVMLILAGTAGFEPGTHA